jgi:hypothetical protein
MWKFKSLPFITSHPGRPWAAGERPNSLILVYSYTIAKATARIALELS